MTTTRVVILAAGKGTRMKSDHPKVLHAVLGRPMLSYVIDAARSLAPAETILVIGHRADLVREAFGDSYTYALQDRQLGTGHAVQIAAPLLGEDTDEVVVLCGDMPLLRGETLLGLRAARRDLGAAATVLTAVLERPPAYGRITRDGAGRFLGIVEERDCTETQRAIREVNLGIYCFATGPLRRALAQLRTDNDQGEYYLTDAPALIRAAGAPVTTVSVDDVEEAMGINDVDALARVEEILRQRG